VCGFNEVSPIGERFPAVARGRGFNVDENVSTTVESVAPVRVWVPFNETQRKTGKKQETNRKEIGKKRRVARACAASMNSLKQRNNKETRHLR
jgi:hypothetical protein